MFDRLNYFALLISLMLISISAAAQQDTIPRKDTIPRNLPGTDSVLPKTDSVKKVVDTVPIKDPVSIKDSASLKDTLPVKTDTIKKSVDFAPSSNVATQGQKVLTGLVKSSTGEILEGASINIKGNPRTIKTDSTGKFNIAAQSGNIFEISFVGYMPKSVPYNNQDTITVVLSPMGTTNETVVVVGYGSQRRSANTGAIASVKSEDIIQTPVVNIAQGLQARVSGLQVTQNNGAPGGNISVRIRGTNSINGSSEPLYVIDGIQISNEAGGNSVSPLNTIPPGDIESVEVLKDASATAIYGARAANGVVLITTKRGRNGETNVAVDVYSGIQEVTKKLPLLDATQFATLENEVYKSNIYPNPSSLGKGTDWQDIIFRTAKIQSAQISVSGGSEKTQFSVSGNYFDQDGVIIRSNYKRYSLRASLDHEINDMFKFGTTILGTYGVNRSIPTASQSTDAAATTQSLLGAAIGAPPTLRPYDDQGYIFPLSDQFNARYREVVNPAGLAEVYSQQAVKRTLANVYLEAKLVKGLLYRASFNADLISSLSDGYSPIYILGAVERNATSGNASKSNSNVTSLLHESVLTYTQDFGKHGFKLTGVYATQGNFANSNTINANGFPNDLTRNEALQLAVNRTVSSNRNREALQSYMGRLNYNYDERYYVDLTARYDGNSKFGSNNKWGFFPAVSGAWRIIQEKFMDKQKFFSDLKIRGSYGLTGNAAAIGPYQSLATVAAGNDYYFDHQYTTGINPSGIPNPDLKWEKSTQANIGLDVAILKNRVSLVVDVYHKKTEDLLFLRQLPISSGYGTIIGNFASVENKGIEFAVNGRIFQGEFKWDANANLSINRNKLLSLAGGVNEFVLNQYGVLRVGEPLGVFKTFRYDGLYQTGDSILPGSDGGPGRPRLVDQNKDGAITEDDQSITGRATPDFIFGFSSNMSYKNFDFSFFVSGVQGNQIFNLSRYTFENALGGRNVLAGMANRWTESNPTNDYAAGLQGGRLPVSDRFIEDGSFIRLKNITLGYNFNKMLGIKNARLYISANNLFTITNYSGFDPEVNTFGGSNTSVGIDNLVYPVAKTYLAGIQVGL